MFTYVSLVFPLLRLRPSALAFPRSEDPSTRSGWIDNMHHRCIALHRCVLPLFAADCREVISSAQGAPLDSRTPNECIVIALFNTRDRSRLESPSSASARCAPLCRVIYTRRHLDSTSLDECFPHLNGMHFLFFCVIQS